MVTSLHIILSHHSLLLWWLGALKMINPIYIIPWVTGCNWVFVEISDNGKILTWHSFAVAFYRIVCFSHPHSHFLRLHYVEYFILFPISFFSLHIKGFKCFKLHYNFVCFYICFLNFFLTKHSSQPEFYFDFKDFILLLLIFIFIISI